MVIDYLRTLFFGLFVKPALSLLLGPRIHHRERLPARGPAILTANHNSHLDTMVMMSLFPLRLLPKLRPAASADYFLKNRWLSWFSTRIVGIIPIPLHTGRPKEEVLAAIVAALESGAIVILFPEGTRGEPEKLGRFKSGVATLCELVPETPVYPVYLHGLGKALPRGEALLVPFRCDGFIGEPLYWTGDRDGFMQALEKSILELSREERFAAWE